MKFQRSDLITRVEAEIERRRNAAAERTAKAQQEHEQRLAEYLENSTAAWQAFAATIRKRASKGLPVTDEDIPTELRNGRGGYVRTYSDRQPTEYVADTGNLETVLSLLKSATDDEVSTTHLERMGFRMATLFRS